MSYLGRWASQSDTVVNTWKSYYLSVSPISGFVHDDS